MRVTYTHWNRRRSRGVIAKLAVVVVSPGVHVSVAAQGQRIIAPGADLRVGEILRCVCRLLHHDRCNLVGLCPIAKLAILIVAPSIRVSVAAHRQRKIEVTVLRTVNLIKLDATASIWRGNGGLLPA